MRADQTDQAFHINIFRPARIDRSKDLMSKIEFIYIM